MISNPAPDPKNYAKIRIRDSENPGQHCSLELDQVNSRAVLPDGYIQNLHRLSNDRTETTKFSSLSFLPLSLLRCC